MTRFTGGGVKDFPVVLRIDPAHTGNGELALAMDIKEAKRLRMELDAVIEWGVNMEDLRRERSRPEGK